MTQKILTTVDTLNAEIDALKTPYKSEFLKDPTVASATMIITHESSNGHSIYYNYFGLDKEEILEILNLLKNRREKKEKELKEELEKL